MSCMLNLAKVEALVSTLLGKISMDTSILNETVLHEPLQETRKPFGQQTP